MKGFLLAPFIGSVLYSFFSCLYFFYFVTNDITADILRTKDGWMIFILGIIQCFGWIYPLFFLLPMIPVNFILKKHKMNNLRIYGIIGVLWCMILGSLFSFLSPTWHDDIKKILSSIFLFLVFESTWLISYWILTREYKCRPS